MGKSENQFQVYIVLLLVTIAYTDPGRFKSGQEMQIKETW